MGRLRFAANRSFFLHGTISATAIAVFLIVFIWVILQPQDDPYRCQALLGRREWSPISGISGVSKEPKPTDCRTVAYPGDGDTLRRCLQGQRIVFAGDSTVRQVFEAAVERFRDQPHTTSGMLDTQRKPHESYSFETEGIKIDYIWDPWLNSSSLNNTLGVLHAQPLINDDGVHTEKNELSAAVIILGAPGLWAARYGGDEYIYSFRHGIDRIKPYISSNLDKSVPMSESGTANSHGIMTQVLLAPVPVPNYSRLSLNRSQTITPRRINEMNRYLAALEPDEKSHILWVFNQILREEEPWGRQRDGLHDSKEVAARKLDVVLNVRCNTASAARTRTFKGTCCVARTNGINVLVSMAASWLALSILLSRLVYPLVTRNMPLPQVGFIRAVRVISFTLIWCQFLDGTWGNEEIGKTERHFDQGNFLKMCLFWLLYCIASLAENIPLPEEPSDDQLPSNVWSIKTPSDNELSIQSETSSNQMYSQTSSDRMYNEMARAAIPLRKLVGTRADPPGYRGPGYLSRDHSDEIKGIMQGLILLYHYHHASRTLWIYKIIRLFISAYFYLSGYGHTLYLLRTKDFSIHRIVSVLVRLNLLSVLLPFVMGTTYDLYYFASVITFWYLVTFAVVSLGHFGNRHAPIFLGKVTAAAFATDWLTSRPDIFQAFSKAMHAVFRASINPEELRFRLGLDRYVVYVGIVVAYLVHAASRRRALTIMALGHARPSWTPRRRRLLNAACVVAAISFFGATQMHPQLREMHEKTAYNAIHPYISWIPILCYVVLRTASRKARDVYLKVPAKLGRVALETYVLQYHVWLGRDATALLTLGLEAVAGRWGRYAEALLFGTAFWGVAVLAHGATDTLARRVDVKSFLVALMWLWFGNIVLGWR
ncbi:Cas1p-domain-containing protein [Hypoxylon sp. FL1150]|nr:Cas1p-domain-containing protein [Hypoxylon sp. FL1150]